MGHTAVRFEYLAASCSRFPSTWIPAKTLFAMRIGVIKDNSVDRTFPTSAWEEHPPLDAAPIHSSGPSGPRIQHVRHVVMYPCVDEYMIEYRVREWDRDYRMQRKMTKWCGGDATLDCSLFMSCHLLHSASRHSLRDDDSQ